jgi:hypothetical protein
MTHRNSTVFADVARVENARQSPHPHQNPRSSTPKNPGISAIERSPKFNNVTDVARSQKSPGFRHVGTPPRLRKRAGGRMWAVGGLRGHRMLPEISISQLTMTAV